MSGRKWTDEEKDYLCEHRGIFSIPVIAEKLNRTPSAVVNESTALGIGGLTANCEYMSTTQAAEYVGLSRRQLLESVYKGKVKAIVKTPNKQKMYFFAEKELERFRKENAKRVVRPFTQYEIATIRGLYYKGVTYAQIGKKLNRHKNVISNKIIAMRKAGEL